MEYKTKLDRVMHYVDRKANFSQTLSVAHAKRAVQYAYNACKEDMIDSIPDLEWTFGQATTIIGTFRIVHCLNYYSFNLDTMGYWINYDSKEEAMQAAYRYYKHRIREALGI